MQGDRFRELLRWLILVPVLLLPGGCETEPGAWSRVQAAGVLRVGMDASFPPFEYVEADGTLAGLDIDLARELGRRLGLEPQFVANLPYDGLYDALAIDRVDVVISALVVNPARTAYVAYSRSYFDAGQVLVVGEGERAIEGVADLSGRTLAVELGSRGDMTARQWARRQADLTLVTHPTAADALTAVGSGAADAAVVDHVSALGSSEAVTIVGEPVVEAPYAVGLDREDERLLREVNRALAAMERDRTLEALRARWLVER